MARKKELSTTIKLIVANTDKTDNHICLNNKIDEYRLTYDKNIADTLSLLRETGYVTLPNSISNFIEELIVVESSSGNHNFYIRNCSIRNKMLFTLIDLDSKNQLSLQYFIEKHLAISKPKDENPHTTYFMVESEYAYKFSSAFRKLGYTVGIIYPTGRKKYNLKL